MVLIYPLAFYLISLTTSHVVSQDYNNIAPHLNDLIRVSPDIVPLIINGTKAPSGLIPYQALLTIGDELLCGGTLISRNYVVTAAHCVDRDLGTDFRVYLGARKLSELAQVTASFLVEQTAITIHPYYNEADEYNIYDIALIRLPQDAQLNDQISTIRLPWNVLRNPAYFRNKIGRISGWGLTTTAGADPQPSDDLLYADVRITGNPTCNAMYNRDNRNLNRRWNQVFTNEHLCTISRSGAGVCFGDSGGPLVIKERDNKWTLVGVIAFFIGDSCESALYGYTFISPTTQEWISGITGIPIRRNR